MTVKYDEHQHYHNRFQMEKISLMNKVTMLNLGVIQEENHVCHDTN